MFWQQPPLSSFSSSFSMPFFQLLHRPLLLRVKNICTQKKCQIQIHVCTHDEKSRVAVTQFHFISRL
jgi:hypothetical protein